MRYSPQNSQALAKQKSARLSIRGDSLVFRRPWAPGIMGKGGKNLFQNGKNELKVL